MLAQFGIPELPAHQGGSASCWRWRRLRASRSATSWVGRPVTVGVWSSGLHMPGGRIWRTRHRTGRAVRGGDEFSHAHAVCALSAAPDKSALAGPVLIGERAVGVEGQREPMGEFFQLVGAKCVGVLSQGALRLHRFGGRHVVGQLAEELLDHLQVLDVQEPCVPSLDGGWQQRRHRLPVRVVRARVVGVADPAAGFGPADPQYVASAIPGGGQPSKCSSRATWSWATAIWRRREVSSRSSTR